MAEMDFPGVKDPRAKILYLDMRWPSKEFHEDQFIRPYYPISYVQGQIEDYDKAHSSRNVVMNGGLA